LHLKSRRLNAERQLTQILRRYSTGLRVNLGGIVLQNVVNGMDFFYIGASWKYLWTEVDWACVKNVIQIDSVASYI